MTEEESGLFQVKFNEDGKKNIGRFAALSYFMLALVLFGSGCSIYLNIMILVKRVSEPGATRPLLNEIVPYLAILFSLLAIASNFYYLRFPRVLLHSIKINDEWGANNAFKMLFKGALIFFIYLVMNSIFVVWSLIKD